MLRMASFQSSISIKAPPERVWPVLSDVVRWPHWMPTVTSLEPLGSGNLEVGNQYRISQPKLRTAIWTVTGLVPNQFFIWESRLPGIRVIGNHKIEPVSAKETTVILSVEFKGLLAGLVGVLYGKLTRDYLRQEAEALKLKVLSLPMN